MKQSGKYILVSIFVILTIVAIACLAINANAETDDAERIKDEKTLVKMCALLARGKDENDKVNSSTLAEILQSYVGSGKITVTEKDADALLVTFLETGREYEVDVNIGVFDVNSGTGLPSRAYTTPYLPTGFSYVEGDLSTGLVIQDESENQYVWVEVPRKSTVYDNLNYDLDSLTGTELTNAYTAIETDLKEYTATYKSSYSDTWCSEEQHGFASADDYNALKQKMLKSVYQNGGFYIGRYEAGIDTNRTSHSTISDTLVPTSKENQYPLTSVYCSEAQTLASRVLSAESTYTSSLMFGVQWDLVLKYLETKGVTEEELRGTTGSTNWGNYKNSTYTLNRGKYAQYGKLSSTWNDYTTDLTGIVESSVKQSATLIENSILCTTGASDQNRKQNIYDLAGNAFEWTLEWTSYTDQPCVIRGGAYVYDGNYAASSRGYYSATYTGTGSGFRVSIF